MKIEKVRVDRQEGPDDHLIKIGEVFPDVYEEDGEYGIYYDIHRAHVILPEWCTVIQDEFGVRDSEEQPSEFSGEGLPPVGTVCEVNRAGYWKECKVIAHFENQVATVAAYTITLEDNAKILDCAIESCFRPIKSEKDKEIEELNKHLDHWFDKILGCRDNTYDDLTLSQYLYNLGYRKTK